MNPDPPNDTRPRGPEAPPGTEPPIVGIGASAGGLSATVELLHHLGPTPNVALVVVHHLDPTHESNLVEILARATSMPVTQAAEGVRVEANHVYVVPPNATLRLERGALKLSPRVEAAGLHLPIDRFFESLAAERGPGAAGVLLTGTGADGAEGIRALRAEGGTTFAQDATAEYRGMPDSAIATGCVDFVLPPAEIARELVRLGAVAQRPLDADEQAREETAFQKILSAVKATSGVDFSKYKRTTLRRRVARRLLVHGVASLREYADLVVADGEEARALSEEILVHVTSFFRDPELFEVLAKSVFPKLVEGRRRDDPIRVWVPGCASGEEVYSIAIALLEFLEDAKVSEIPLKLFGTDVSLSAIEKARAGTYPLSIEHDVSPGRLQRFFTKRDTSYQIRKDVRDLCVFAKHDATHDPPFSGMDLVSCRNLMIYLGRVLQDRILPVLHYALKQPGFLALGLSETIGSFPGFSVLDAKTKVYVRSAAVPRLLFDFPVHHPATQPSSPQRTRTMGPPDVQREADRLILEEFSPPGVVVTDDMAIVQFRGKTGPFLDPTPGVASFDLLRMVKPELRLPIRRAINEARDSRSAKRQEGVWLGSGPTARSINFEVIPFGLPSTAQRFFVVLFQEDAPTPPAATTEGTAPAPAVQDSSHDAQLAQELASTRSYLEAVIEQLEASNEELTAANEEVVSSNEELRSTNEELQLAKEELQATNEELRTVNEEMVVRNADGMRLNDDLVNVLSSVEIPIVLLGRDLRVRRATPAAASVFRIAATDAGRSIRDLEPRIRVVDLEQMVSGVLVRLGAATRSVQDDEGHWYQLTVRPYMTTDNRIDGTVLTLFDIDAVKKGEALVQQARDYAEGVVDTVRECLVVLDADLRVVSANRAFYRMFDLTPDEIRARPFVEIGHGEWNIPALKSRLEKMGEADMLEDFRVEGEFKGMEGARSFVLNARRMERQTSILLAFHDETERVRAEAAVRRAEGGFRELLATAADAIVMADDEGAIRFANPAAAKMFGYPADELLGLRVEALVPERLRAKHVDHRSTYMSNPTPRTMGMGRDLRGRRKDGSEFPVEVVLGSMPAEKGQLAVSFVSDITDRKTAETALREYQSRLQQMAFDAALAEERERRRIAADLHDRIGQSLALAQIKLTGIKDGVAGLPRAAIDQSVELIAQAIAEARTLTFELSPPVLYDLGLKAALSWLVEDMEKRHGIKIDLHDDELEKPLHPPTAALLFRAVRELLMNVFKHASTSSATVSLRRMDDHFDIQVEDRGVGFNPEDVRMRSAPSGFGLFSVREQIDRLGGRVDVSSSPARGTRVTMTVPLLPSVPGNQKSEGSTS